MYSKGCSLPKNGQAGAQNCPLFEVVTAFVFAHLALHCHCNVFLQDHDFPSMVWNNHVSVKVAPRATMLFPEKLLDFFLPRLDIRRYCVCADIRVERLQDRNPEH